ncbi:hypothetical protein T02_2637 [Trichinella nativa]|uniref:Uncharacterized protein n=1 Tax=Trichinella nativa TaxID=6335 RepID=A0A0V1L3R5_9BILA|nr:hypothetical protein T02_2637 [Trichinella nativa]
MSVVDFKFRFCIRLTRNGFNDKQLSEISLQYIKFEKLSLKKSITNKYKLYACMKCNFQITVISTKPTGWKNVAKFEKNISFFAGAIGDDEYFYKNKVLKSSCDLQLKFASI